MTDQIKCTRQRLSWLANHGHAEVMRTCNLLLLVAVLTGSPIPAMAQPSDDFRSRARIRAGALYLTPSFRLERLGIETNVFSEAEPKRDFVVSVSPRVDAWLPIQRRALLSMTFIAGADYYATYASERSFNPDVRFQLEVPARRVTFFAGGDYLNTRRRPDFEIDVRSRRVVREVNGGVTVNLVPRLSIGLEGSQQRIRFDADAVLEGTFLSETLNRDERAVVAAVRWRRTVLSTFEVATELRSARFVRSPDRDADNVIVTVGAEFHPRALVSGSGRIGVRRFDGLRPSLPDIATIVGLADLSYRFGANTRLTFTIARDIRYGFKRMEPYYVISRYTLAVTRRLRGAFDVVGGLSRDFYDYQSLSGRTEARWNVSGTVGYRLNATTRAGFQFRYINRDSTTRARRSYDGLEAGLVVDYGI